LVDGDFVTATTALSFSDTISHSSPIVLTDGTNVSNVEKFTNVTTGSGNDTISYSQRNQNKFSTGSGDDTINAGLGADTVDGGTDPNTGADNDLLIVDYSSNTYTGTDSGTYSSVYSNGQGEFEGFFTAAFSNGQADILHFSNINRFQVTATGANDNIYTGDGNDTIVGGAGNDSINSFAGNDSIDGGAGNDTIVGGDGNDSYIVDSIGDVVNETSTLTTEIDNVQSSVTYGLGANLENLTLTGTSRINGTGNSLNNTITGNSAANGISGGAGDDTMTGGAGNDVYIVDSVGDVISETSVLTTEIDTVWSGVSYTLGANVERLTLIGTSAINGTGNSLNNTVTGNSANNTLFGGIGNDILIGASGNDSLTGGDGSDRFIYDTNVAFTSSAIGIDQITDFVSGTDKIVLDKTTFTALTSITGNGFNLASEFAVVGTDAAASTSSALIVYSSETDNLFYNQNGVTSGLGSGAQLATLSGITTLSASDFELQA
jgi:Ca2+-binding RTX toxin-like protein